MNVVESDNMTSTISYLRQNIYNLPSFRSSLINNLNTSINANEIHFIPDQYGGWNVDVKFDPSSFDSSLKSSDFYLTRVSVALHNTLIELNAPQSDISNLINVTMTGSNNIVIKL